MAVDPKPEFEDVSFLERIRRVRRCIPHRALVDVDIPDRPEISRNCLHQAQHRMAVESRQTRLPCEDLQDAPAGAMVDVQQHVEVRDRKDSSHRRRVAAIAKSRDITEDIVERIKVLSVVVRERHRCCERGVHVLHGGPFLSLELMHQIAEICQSCARAVELEPSGVPEHEPRLQECPVEPLPLLIEQFPLSRIEHHPARHPPSVCVSDRDRGRCRRASSDPLRRSRHGGRTIAFRRCRSPHNGGGIYLRRFPPRVASLAPLRSVAESTESLEDDLSVVSLHSDIVRVSQ